MGLIFPDPIFSEQPFVQMLQYAETVTHGGFSITILLVIFGVLFFMMRQYGPERAMATSAFITSFFAILIRFLFLNNDRVVFIAIIIFIIGFFLLKNSNDGI